jgi:hypothetical protein
LDGAIIEKDKLHELVEQLYILSTKGSVCELDETFVLESYKGSEIPLDFYRKPRNHGAKSSKRGLSSEQICICADIIQEVV